MKKTLLLLSLLTAFSCAEPYDFNPNEEVIVSDYVNPFLDCFIVRGTSSGHPECNNSLAIFVIDYKNRNLPGTNNYYETYTICIDTSRYVQNDFRLGKIICDLKEYQ